MNLLSFSNYIIEEDLHMRSSRIETEKKGKVTSLRLTEEQSALLHSKATKKGMSLSNYIITAAINSETSLTPELLVLTHNLINEACKAVSDYAPEKAKSLQEGMNKLWQRLK